MIRVRTCLHLALLACGLASAQPADLAQQLAPCLSLDTMAVAKLDVPRIDIEALARMAVGTGTDSMSSDEIDELRGVVERQSRTWQKHLSDFEEAGGESLFVIVNLTDVVLAIPRTSRLDEAKMKAWLEGLDDEPVAVSRRGRFLVAMRPWEMERRKDQPTMQRGELNLASDKITGAPVQIFLVPSVDARRVMEAMLPGMLGSNFELRDGALLRGLQWATIRVDLPPVPSLTAFVQSADTTAATALREFIVGALTRATEIPALRGALPKVQGLVSLLTPQVDGNTLKLSVDETQSRHLVTRFLTPGLFQLRESILRERCLATLSGMGKAMLIYANDHEDRWPPNLKTLVQTVEYNPTGLLCAAMRHRPDYASYVYRGVDTGGVWVEPMIIMVHDRAGNHEGGRNVLFVDSHVEWVTEDRFLELVQQDNELRRKRGLLEKPAF